MLEEGRLQLHVHFPGVEELEGLEQAPLVPHHKIAGEQAEGPALAAGIVDEQAAVLLLAVFDEVDCRDHHLLLGDVLDGALVPVEGQEGYVVGFLVILHLLAGAVYHVADQVGLEELGVLREGVRTCAMYWSARKSPSQIFIGMEKLAVASGAMAKWLIRAYNSINQLELRIGAKCLLLKSQAIHIIPMREVTEDR